MSVFGKARALFVHVQTRSDKSQRPYDSSDGSEKLIDNKFFSGYVTCIC